MDLVDTWTVGRYTIYMSYDGNHLQDGNDNDQGDDDDGGVDDGITKMTLIIRELMTKYAGSIP